MKMIKYILILIFGSSLINLIAQQEDAYVSLIQNVVTDYNLRLNRDMNNPNERFYAVKLILQDELEGVICIQANNLCIEYNYQDFYHLDLNNCTVFFGQKANDQTVMAKVADTSDVISTEEKMLILYPKMVKHIDGYGVKGNPRPITVYTYDLGEENKFKYKETIIYLSSEKRRYSPFSYKN